jgi:hypothetical protein
MGCILSNIRRNMLSPSEASFRHLKMRAVVLKSRNWDMIFQHFVALDILFLGYNVSCETAQYALLFEGGLDTELESRRNDDVDAMEDLETVIETTRRDEAGLSPWWWRTRGSDYALNKFEEEEEV